jgi:hypothetical protein
MIQQTKQCNKCNLIKPINEFRTFYCIQCKKEIDRIYYLNNKEKIKKKTKKEIALYNKNYYLNNKNKYIKYKEDNFEKIKAYNRDYTKQKYSTDPDFKIRKLYSYRLNMALKFNFKSGNTIGYLGCSIEEFKKYLETQFLPEFTWDNHGEIWEIDHIIPCSHFDLTIEENIIKCFHYSNHQPLFKTTEIAKSFGYKNQIGNKNKGKNKIQN